MANTTKGRDYMLMNRKSLIRKGIFTVADVKSNLSNGATVRFVSKINGVLDNVNNDELVESVKVNENGAVEATIREMIA